MKMIIRNCPALRYDRKRFKVCYDKNANLKCEEINDCMVKNIINLCKNKIEFCKKCAKNADLVIDCVECNEGGESHLAQSIINNFIDIEEIKDEDNEC